MTGQDILRARQGAGVSQPALVKALGLGGRMTLTDIEHGRVEVTPAWVLKAIGVIDGIATKLREQAA